MSPLPGSHVIHPRMLDAIGAVAVPAQTGTGQLVTLSSTSTFDDTTGRSTPGAPTVAYTGSCRVQATHGRGAPVVQAGEEPVTLPYFQISVPMAAPVAVHQQWHMTSCSDAQLVDKTFTVIDVAYGTLQAERHLICTLNETDG